MNARLKFAAAALIWACAANAHDDGTPHHDAPPTPALPTATQSSDRPHRIDTNRLHVPKPVQHLLGIRTAVSDPSQTELLQFTGEVLPSPDAAGLIQAPQSGRLEMHATRWPLPGQVVKAGDALAVLIPSMSERERAQRRASLAVIEQKLNLARINASRLHLQADAGGSVPATENVYLEQADAELATQQRLQRLAQDTIGGRVILRATLNGTVGSVKARPGDVVSAGGPLFEISSASHTRFAVSLYDAALAERIRTASTRLPTGEVVQLKVAGQEPESGKPGWRLLLDTTSPASAPIYPGQTLPLSLVLAPAPGAPCVDAGVHVWVHTEPEIFERRSPTADCAALLQTGDRSVVQGSALLDEYW